MAEVGRDLWVHLLQPPLQQGHPDQSAQDHVQVAFGDLQGGDSTTSLVFSRYIFMQAESALPCSTDICFRPKINLNSLRNKTSLDKVNLKG